MTTCLRVTVLIVVYFLYVFCGGAIFMVIERDNDTQLQLQLREALLLLTNETCLDISMLDAVLKTLGGGRADQARFLLRSNTTQDTWSFIKTSGFAVTVITTIGYGDRTPKTQGGRAFCIFYGIVGIPLTLILLRHIGEGLRDRMENLIQKCCIRVIREKTAVRAVLVSVMGIVAAWLAPSALYQLVADWTYLDAIYFVFITQSTIGFGDLLLPDNPTFGAFAVVHVFIGLSLVSLNVSCMANAINNNFENIDTSHLQNEVERLKKELHRVKQRSCHGPRTAEVTSETHSRTERNTSKGDVDLPHVPEERPENILMT